MQWLNQDISEVIYHMRNLEGTQQFDYDDISTKTQIVSTRFCATFGVLRLDKKSFFSSLLGFTPFWDYKQTNAVHADSPRVYTGEKKVNLRATDEIHSKSECIDGSAVTGAREPIFFSLFSINFQVKNVF